MSKYIYIPVKVNKDSFTSYLYFVFSVFGVKIIVLTDQYRTLI